MIVVTLSRRPLGAGSVAANVLTHGVGALNVDASRVVHRSNADLQTSLTKNPGRDEKFSSGVYGEGRYQQSVNSEGRWPANFILGHRSGCRMVGTREVERCLIDATAKTTSSMFGVMGGSRSLGSVVETIPTYVCASDCPVNDLDQQSGVSVSSGGRVGNKDGGTIYGGGHGLAGAYTAGDPGFGDIGGASRYFKQVGGCVETTAEMASVPQDLLDYLTKLITPEHVGGESLVALDIDAVDWTSIPDGRYHGIIARGEPTPEQVDHMWRVVRPGAHVLLIAPEERKTGHRGACALEDRGFEIRDAILWVNEAGKLHYVPKANTKERNLGCEKLAAKRKGPPVYELTEAALADEEIVGEIQDALLEAGVPEDVVEALAENGIPKDKVPPTHKECFKKREGSGKYGNNHPTVKARGVMARLLRDVPEGATVLDPFMGSGTTALACLETGHNFIGIEREAEYLEISDARVRYWDRATAAWVATVIESEAPQDPSTKTESAGALFDLFDE